MAVCQLVIDAIGGPKAGTWREVLTARGWELGKSACAAGSVVHEMIAELDALRDVLLEACEQASGDASQGSSAADGLRIARRIDEACSLLVAVAAAGFAGCHGERLREQYRALRHDLRNPLSTIKSAVAMMQDASMPDQVRSDPRFLEIIARNTSALDALIGERLGDAAATTAALAPRAVSLRDLALHVCRELNAAAREAECEIAVSSDLPTASIDVALATLMLKTVVGAALAHSPPQRRIAIQPAAVSERSVAIAVVYEGDAEGLDVLGSQRLVVAEEMAERTGGKISFDGRLVIEVPRLAG